MPYEEHVRELGVLKLLNKAYTPEDYRVALEKYLKVRIKVKEVPELIRGDGLGQAKYDPENRTILIFIPAHLTWWMHQFVLFHELAHLVAAHPFVERSAETGETGRTLEPGWRRLARKAPITAGNMPQDLPETYRRDLHGLREHEADLRAQYSMLTAQLGARALELDRLNQV